MSAAFSCSMRCCACKASCRSIRRHDGRAPDLSLQHRHQLHHQHQLAELRRRKHAVLSRADARPDASELPLGGNRHRARGGADPRLRARLGEDRRQFLGRYHPLHALHPAADLHSSTPCSSSGRACRRRSAPMSMRRRWKAPSRPSPSARSPRRSPSRCSAPMAAASSTPTRRIRSRTRRRCRTSSRWSRSSRIGAALTNVFGRMVGNQRQGWAILAAMGVLFLAGVVVCYWAEAAGNPQFARARPRPRQHGRQGGPLRHRRCRPCSR